MRRMGRAPFVFLFGWLRGIIFPNCFRSQFHDKGALTLGRIGSLRVFRVISVKLYFPWNQGIWCSVGSIPKPHLFFWKKPVAQRQGVWIATQKKDAVAGIVRVRLCQKLCAPTLCLRARPSIAAVWPTLDWSNHQRGKARRSKIILDPWLQVCRGSDSNHPVNFRRKTQTRLNNNTNFWSKLKT